MEIIQEGIVIGDSSPLVKRWYYEDVTDKKEKLSEKDDALPSHVQFLMSRDLLRPFMQTWLQETTNRIMTDRSNGKNALRQYSQQAYKLIWNAYEQNDFSGTYAYLFSSFRNIWTGANLLTTPLLNSTILFEGQGRHEEIDSDLLTLGTVIHRKRPSSTTWNLHSALGFINDSFPIILVHHIIQSSQQHSPLLAVNMQALFKKTQTQWMECEVLLQPEIYIESQKVELVTLDYACSFNWPTRIKTISVTIIHCNTYCLGT